MGLASWARRRAFDEAARIHLKNDERQFMKNCVHGELFDTFKHADKISNTSKIQAPGPRIRRRIHHRSQTIPFHSQEYR